MIRFSKFTFYTLLLNTFLLTPAVQALDKRKGSCIHPSSAATPVRNVILLIGDGMGVAHVSAAMLAGGAPLSMQQADYSGLLSTASASSKVTDSAAAATALATGTKTTNNMVGVAPDSTHLRTILERAETKGMATGLIATHSITDATPAAFIAHNPNRSEEEAIAADFLKTDIDLFIGGGRAKFEARADGRNLSEELRSKGYRIGYSLDSLAIWHTTPAALLLAEGSLPMMTEGRGNMLPLATQEALRLLSESAPQGFFLMVEGSNIDNAGHSNDSLQLMAEMWDFDAAVRIAKAFADRTPGTLVLITADHETGGLSLPATKQTYTMGKSQPDTKSSYRLSFSTKSHTAAMVPLYIYGTGAERFGAMTENSELPRRIAQVLELPE